MFGSNGMLGSTVTRYLSNNGIQVIEVNRSGQSVHTGNVAHAFDVLNGSVRKLLANIEKPEYIINCVGLIKQKIEAGSYTDLRKAIAINSQFPIDLSECTEKNGAKLIQIATDCVFSGSKGGYSEEDQRDPTDVYGYSKALGEVCGDNLMTIRCSIIGHELNSSSSLLNWVLSHEINSEINGFTNHYWNGITTLHFAKTCEAIIKNSMFHPITLHHIPKDTVSKFELVKLICTAFGRSDISVRSFDATESIDRTLSTTNERISNTIWEKVGYKTPPTVEKMIQEYADWTYNV